MTENVPATMEDSPKSIRSYLASDRFAMEARKLLGDPALASRFARVCLTTIQADSKLMRCDARTMAGALLQLAEVGLEPGRDAYLIPRGDAVTVTIRWEGYVRAARASGDITRIWSDVIRERDSYQITGGSDVPRVTHSYQLGASRGEIVGAYACAEWRDGTVETLVVDRDYLDRCRACSDAKGGSSPWTKWPEQMAKKVAIKRLCKGLPLGNTDKLSAVTSIDNAADDDAEVVIEETPRTRGVEGLRSKLLPAETVEDEPPPAAPPKRTRKSKVIDAAAVREALADSGAPLTEDDLVTFLIMHQHCINSLEEAPPEVLAELRGRLLTAAGCSEIRDILDNGLKG